MRLGQLTCFGILVLTVAITSAAEELDRFAKWSKIEFAFAGPESRGRAEPNPFAIRLDVTFTSPGGTRYQVPGFYDGDGRGGLDGNVWKVRFSADEVGVWTFRTRSNNARLDGKTGRYSVTAVSRSAKGFWRLGRLEYTGTRENGIRYLKFRDGPYWLKAGCDDPENFLGKYRSYDTLAKRKAAIDYLTGRGVNSLYIMTHNLGGDDRDVWPWLGETAREAMANGGAKARFDVAKLEQWRELFEHMQEQGVVPYLVLEDDSAWKGYDHERYYREIIARFGYLPALIFNMGEEHNENYRLSEALDWMKHLAETDPYDHPRGIHNVNRPTDQYVKAAQVDFTAIQTGSPGSRKGLDNALEHNRIAIDWINRCKSLGQRPLMVGFDEGRPEQHRAAWWAAYMGGGVWEAHVLQPYDRPMSSWEPTWTELGGARAFMETLPFWEMEPRNDLVKSGKALCFAQIGRAYALYLPTGGSITVELADGATYDLAWWNPGNGKDGRFQDKGSVTGGAWRLTAPGDGDWALRIVRVSL
ncbi:MAG: DUF5060 domain-containing protein [Planctomycetes bacterium]|nr:DUF5060 domain-containing protein [Planctomycetota bacterium]MBL7038906.1 DUF5060 domain-containing protein [Pirellulaceae bacterium]